MNQYTLTLTAGGGAELVEDQDVIWTSQDDEDFRDEFPDEMLDEDDVDKILEYLVDEDFLTEAEAATCEVEEESATVDNEEDDDADDL